MKSKLIIALAVAGLLATALPMWAHHAFASEFDANRPLKLEGVLKKWEMINPHSWFHIDVKGSDGKVTEWMVEGGSPNSLIRLGVTKETVPIGTKLTISAYQARDGANRAVGRDFTLPNGQRLFLSQNLADVTPEGK
jgi:hypothetical protein